MRERDTQMPTAHRPLAVYFLALGGDGAGKSVGRHPDYFAILARGRLQGKRIIIQL